MALDYHTAKYPISEAAKAIGMPLNTLRAYFQRGHFRVIGKAAEKPGLPHTINLTGIMGMAVANELIAAGAHPKAAFSASMLHFAHGSHGSRLPGRMYPDAPFTVMLFYPATGDAKVLPFTDKLDFVDLFHASPSRGTPIVLLLNYIEVNVFDALGIGRGDGDA